MKHSIIIVDDHLLIAKALRGIIDNFPDFEVIHECENGVELQNYMAQHAEPSLVLLDISMPVMDGFATAAWLKECHPEVKVMALSMQDDEESVIKMITHGAKGYLLKNTHPSELEQALLRLMNHGFYYPDWAASKVFANLSAPKTTTPEVQLTPREKEFLNYTVTEMNYKEIADKMCCSPRTVESYRDSLFEKLELKSRVGLAVYALKNGYAEGL